jgi:hypothetical protein
MVGKESKSSPPVWTYAYQIVPPQTEERLHALASLLAREHEEARHGARTWVGRVVLAQMMTHILIVSDSPEQGGKANRRLEAELAALNVGFSITAPMAVADDRPESPVHSFERYRPNAT